MVRPWTTICVTVSLLAAALLVSPVAAESIRRPYGRGRRLPLRTPTGAQAAAQPATEPTVPPPRPIVVKLEGSVTGIHAVMPDGSYLVFVDGVEVRFTSDTDIRPIGFTLRVEDHVIVNALLEGSTLTATYVRIRTEDEIVSQNPIEFRGIITRLPEGLYADQDEEWTIGGRTVEVDTKATVIGPPPETGYYAHVMGYIQPNGNVRATSVEVLNPLVIAAKFEFEGTIQEIASSIPGFWTIGGVPGVVVETTMIEGDAEIGAIAEVRGRRLDGGILAFEHIRVLTPAQPMIRVEGLIEEIEIQRDGILVEGHLVVDGKWIEVDGMTFIDESRGRAKVGMWAEVTARRLGQYLYALRVVVERPE